MRNLAFTSSLLLIGFVYLAPVQAAAPASAAKCSMTVSSLDAGDQPLSYAALSLRSDVNRNADGTLFTAPVRLADGSEARFLVAPNGCMSKRFDPFN